MLRILAIIDRAEDSNCELLRMLKLNTGLVRQILVINKSEDMNKHFFDAPSPVHSLAMQQFDFHYNAETQFTYTQMSVPLGQIDVVCVMTEKPHQESMFENIRAFFPGAYAVPIRDIEEAKETGAAAPIARTIWEKCENTVRHRKQEQALEMARTAPAAIPQ